MRSATWVAAILVLLASGIAPAQPAQPAQISPGTQQAARFERQVLVTMQYLIYLPEQYEQQASWPLLLFLHGAGERGDDLQLVKVHGPPKLIAAGKSFPFIVVSPQCPREQWWDPDSLVALLDEVQEKFKVDADRVYATGLSMGGFGTWRLAAQVPQRLAAIVPICGGGETIWTGQLTHLPVWAFHGAKDPVVPLERTQAMVDALKERGGHPQLTVYPDAGHDAWTATYENEALYEWLLGQKRGLEE